MKVDLENIACDDKKGIDDYTVEEVLKEAEYVLSCFNEGGHSLNEDLESESKEVRNNAKKQIRQLENYIKKYSN